MNDPLTVGRSARFACAKRQEACSKGIVYTIPFRRARVWPSGCFVLVHKRARRQSILYLIHVASPFSARLQACMPRSARFACAKGYATCIKYKIPCRRAWRTRANSGIQRISTLGLIYVDIRCIPLIRLGRTRALRANSGIQRISSSRDRLGLKTKNIL